MPDKAPAADSNIVGNLCRGPRQRVTPGMPEAKGFEDILMRELAFRKADPEMEIVKEETDLPGGGAPPSENTPADPNLPPALAFLSHPLWQHQWQTGEPLLPSNAGTGKSASLAESDVLPDKSLPNAAKPRPAENLSANATCGGDAVRNVEITFVALVENDAVTPSPVISPRRIDEGVVPKPGLPDFPAGQSEPAPDIPQNALAASKDRQQGRDPGADHGEHGLIGGDAKVAPLISLPAGTAAGMPTPARQIVEQLRLPVSAALRVAAVGEQPAAPLKHLKIVLTPDDLGEIAVSLSFRGGGLAIAIGASEPRTVEMLMRERKLLDGLLLPLADDHGVRAVTITVQPHGIPASPGLSENHQSPFPESGRSGDPGANRRETPPDKEGRSSRPDTGTSVHDEHSAIRTGHPGSLVV